MKKVCLTAMMLVLMVAGAYAQAQIGLKGGLNYSTIGGDNVDDLKGKIGYHVGGMAAFGLTESVFIQPELVLSLQGAAFDGDEDVKWNITYVNIPVMAKVFLTESVNLQFGPQLGFVVASKAKFEDVEVDFKDETNSVDFGVGLGLGYESPMGLSIGARYNYGLGNINKDGDDKNNNSVLQLSLGYFFNKR